MNVLDSRFLQIGDCFMQRFSKSGVFKYVVSTGAASCISIDEAANEVVVKSTKEGGKAQQRQQQHNIVVRRKDSALVAEPSRIEIQQGDILLWYTTDASVQGFAVVGEGKNGTFSSVVLTHEAIYSHAFGTPGTYEWVDAYDGQIHGVVVVKWTVDTSQPQDCRKLLEELGKGTLIRVTGYNVEPNKIEILTGQTVFWAVEKSAGITITDTRLLRGVKERVSSKD
jgi:plastocyanin